jgi:type IV pilus assembly protein PilY1
MTTRRLISLSLVLTLLTAWTGTQAASLSLADQPLFSTTQVPGNLVLDLSVEFPTANSVAHAGTANATYNSANTYLGYFDPSKCYVYNFVDVETSTSLSHFAPGATATARQCTGTAANMWSGNYINWATTQTIDPFRWAMTGGYRVVDTASLTLLEKAWATPNQGGTANFPDRVLSTTTDLEAATPFQAPGSLTAYVQGRGPIVNFIANGAADTGGFLGTYFNDAGNGTHLVGNPVLTRTESINFDFSVWGNGSPKTGVVNTDNFSARWVTSFVVPSTGYYTFQTVSDDGVRVYVNGNLVINNWTDHGTTTNTSNAINFNAGDVMNIRVEYYEKAGGAVMQFYWRPPNDPTFRIFTAGGAGWPASVRVKVCDPAAAGGLESNCVGYANGNYKPEGLMQKYANKIRYSVFGYLNDSDINRDGGVLRAAQKFVGPTYPVPGSAALTNPAAEWDASTGIFATNPDSASATATNNNFAGATVTNSGAINYVNKFGEITPGAYKTYDPVGELYYASLRYLKNQGNVSTWTDMTGASNATRKTWADGFPVIRTWTDPIQYACQKNFILGIGDVNTHADKNVPGPTSTATEPTKPGPADGLMGDTSYSATYNAVTATNKVGELQGLGNTYGTAMNVGGCCNNNAALMAGLAYDANTRDIRNDLAGTQTVQTYWVDVLEYQTFKPSNQFYLAAKFGGFKVPSGFDPYARTTALDSSWWHTNTDTVGTGTDAQPRPDNYFTGGQPDLMVTGLTSAFAQIADSLSATASTGFVTASPNQSLTGASYASSYSPKNWTGSVTGSSVSYSATDGTPTTTLKWDTHTTLDAMAASARKIVTCCAITTVSGQPTASALPFNTTTTNPTLSARTLYASFASVPGVAAASQSATNFLNYLRGDRSLEVGQTSGVYRKRDHLMGDIVNSKLLPVGPPEARFFDSTNPGYSAFKKAYKNRKPVVYAGANDGMLHAIDGTVPVGTEATTGGSELFAYVPSFLYGSASTYASSGLAALGNPSYTHSYRVDGQMMSLDVNFNQSYSVTGSGAALSTGDWHTVLVGGLGKGGKGYYALDVTDPSSWTGTTTAIAETAVSGKVLWEFPAAPELRTSSNPRLAAAAAAADTMGYSYGKPQIVKTARYGWVALLASGYNNADGKGYLYLVDIKTGGLIDTLVTPEGSTSAPINLAQVTGYIPDSSNFLVEAAYGADMRGNVWRFDLRGTGAYSAPKKIAVLSNSSGTLQSVTAPLRIAVDGTSGNKRYILIGTGQLLDNSDITNTDTQSFYALVDGDKSNFFTDTTLPANKTYPITRSQLQPVTSIASGASNVTVGWYLDLKLPTDPSGAIAYRVTQQADFSSGIVAFAANQPNGDPCSPSGNGRLFLLSMGNGQTKLTTGADFIPTTSEITDFAIKYINGKTRTICITRDGQSCGADFPAGSTVPLSRLNWREAPTDQ